MSRLTKFLYIFPIFSSCAIFVFFTTVSLAEENAQGEKPTDASIKKIQEHLDRFLEKSKSKEEDAKLMKSIIESSEDFSILKNYKEEDLRANAQAELEVISDPPENSRPGRFVLYQDSTRYTSGTFLLDSQTGNIWRLVIDPSNKKPWFTLLGVEHISLNYRILQDYVEKEQFLEKKMSEVKAAQKIEMEMKQKLLDWNNLSFPDQLKLINKENAWPYLTDEQKEKYLLDTMKSNEHIEMEAKAILQNWDKLSFEEQKYQIDKRDIWQWLTESQKDKYIKDNHRRGKSASQ